MDVHVCEAIFKKLIKGILLKRNKTIIMAISQYRFLKHADNVILLENSTLITNPALVKEYLLNSQDQHHHHQRQRSNSKDDNLEDEIDEEDVKVREKEEEERLKAKEKRDEEEAEKNEEAREVGTLKRETILLYIKSMGVFVFCIFIVLNYMMYGSRVFQDFWLKDQMQSPDFHLQSFVKTMLILTGITVGVTFLRAFTWCFLSMRAAQKIFFKLNHKILYSKMSFFDKNAIGRLISRLSGDIWTIDDYLAWVFHVFFENISRCTGFFGGIVFQIPEIVVFFVVCWVMLYSIQKRYRPLMRDLKRLDSVNSSKVYTHITESLQGAHIIRAFKKESVFKSQFIKIVKTKTISGFISSAMGLWLDTRLTIVAVTVFVLVAGGAATIIVFDIAFDLTSIAMIITYVVLLTNFLLGLVTCLVGTEQAFISVERVKQYFDNETEDLEEVKPIEDQAKHDIVPLPDESVIFKNVWMSYAPETDSNRSHAIRKLDLVIKKGEKVAICGRTGSGKTSILNMLFRLYPIEKGFVYVDGKEFRDYSIHDLRAKMAIIP